ncbi:MAG: recombinase family protein [Pirellulaceae bacterium]|nr:recombinase family protein [Pirellulaceae bacterium]
MSNKPTPRPRTIRCAIYTRKSTEEGLDQQYNSLDAQRDAGESYIRSQVNEGWEIVHDRYDDGGFSGGNIERPALKRLMEDIQAGKIDCVIVYKVDRLSRSLLDFARVMETFDKYSVSFVSVTQHFNTTHSMGRLTLNILLSFAQFEREIIGERIRDKLAAQCRRGQWTGGYPVLGYDVDRSERTPKLVINSEEATKVRRIFSLYLELKNLLPVVHELDERGWTNKLWHSKKGLPKGGRVFDKGSVHALLTNPIYCGKIKHKTDLYQGQHQAIVDTDIFDRVQAQLRENGFNRGNRMPSKHGGLLKGIIRCPHCNVAMVHNMTKRNSIVYRYYTCVRAIKRGRQSCRHPSLPAGEIEAAVVDQVRDISRDIKLRDEIIRQAMVATQQGRSELESHHVQLTRQLTRDHGEIRELALDQKPNNSITHRIVDIQERIEKAELELAKVNRQLSDLDKQQLTTDEIQEAFIDFDRIWDAMTTREKSQLLSLLVSKVEFDQSDCTIAITFHASGIDTLDQQSQEV